MSDALPVGNLERPGSPWRATEPRLEVEGWVFAPDGGSQVRGVIARCRGRDFPLAYGLPREDVAAAYREQSAAHEAGFRGDIILRGRRASVQVLVELTSGELRPMWTVVVENRFDRRYRYWYAAQDGLFLLSRQARRVMDVMRAGVIAWHSGRRPRDLGGWRQVVARARKRWGGTQAGRLAFMVDWDPYPSWVINNTLTEDRRAAMATECRAWEQRPLISVLLPVHRVDPEWLLRAISSVQGQIYDNWELCVAEDASGVRAIQDLLRDRMAGDSRIRVRFLPENLHISRATNAAAEMAQGEFLAFLDHDDEMEPDALWEVARLLQAEPAADIIYTDDDKVDSGGRRYEPQFKPDWSPELLLSYAYVGHLLVVRKSLFMQCGGFRQGFEGAQDYDFLLRAGEVTDRIHHVPKVLYHWRALRTSTASEARSKDYSIEAGRRALQEAAERRRLRARAEWPEYARAAGIGVYALRFAFSASNAPKVSIIIPTRNRVDLLRTCIDSVMAVTSYPNFEIIVADNDSDDPATLEYLGKLPHRVVRVANGPEGFNFSRINNLAAQAADGQLLLFLNNDIEAVDSGWLTDMVGYSQVPGVGAVGARLLYDDGRVQHGGVLLGALPNGLPAPAFRGFPGWSSGYLNYLQVTRDYSAVTAACMLIRRDVFFGVGGFDEGRFAVAYNDVDLCLRLRREGYRIVYDGWAMLRHNEGSSRGFGDNVQEERTFLDLWGSLRDPYYNANLFRDGGAFRINPMARLAVPQAAGPRVLAVSHNLNLEGAPISQLLTVTGLAEKGFAITVLAPRDGPLRSRYERAGVDVRIGYHPLEGAGDVDSYRARLWTLQQFLAEGGFRLVYANTLDAHWAVDAAHRSLVPAVWNIRESVDVRSYFKPLPRDLGERALACFSAADCVVFVAEATRRLYAQQLDIPHTAVVHNGLDHRPIEAMDRARCREEVRSELGLPPTSRLVTTVGTTCERKAQHLLVDAAEILAPAHPDVCYVFVGGRESPYLSELRRRIESRRLGDHVRIVMETPAALRYYAASDIFACTSYQESFPRVILEAMAFGLPIVSTDVFGIPEAVDDGREGLLVPPGNVERLAGAVGRLLDDDDLAERLGAAAEARLHREFTLERMVSSYERLFRSFIEGQPEHSYQDRPKREPPVDDLRQHPASDIRPD